MEIDIDGNKEKIIELLKSTKREGIDALIRAKDDSDFFIAPASSKYHLAEPGGLAQHSLLVLNGLDKLNNCFGLQIPDESIKIMALEHDDCKIGLYTWSATQQRYIRIDNMPLGHGEKSVIWIQQYIKLTDLEKVAIRWHMTAYEPGWDRDGFRVQNLFPQAMALYFADHIATVFLEK